MLQFLVLNRRFALFALLMSSLLLGISVGQRRAAAADNWEFPNRRLRVPVSIGANGFDRLDKPADVNLNFTALISATSVTGSFDSESLRVVEVDNQGSTVNPNVDFQFDPDADFKAITKAAGTLIVMLDGQTNAAAVRHFHVYFDVAGESFSTPTVAPRIVFTDGIMSQGFSSYKFETDAATYVYHKQGGGFASLIDKAGNDWISWNAANGSAGDFRGIPNLVNPNDGGYFHPGRTTSTSSVVNEGPLKVTIKSTSNNKAWETIWEVYPEYARLTVTKKAVRYWFLYEGTPGGELTNTDRIVRPNENQTAGFGSWTADIPGDEWVYVRDNNVSQALFLIHEQSDTLVDSYRAQDNLMTVFGFGRNDGSGRYLSLVPQSFVFGFGESNTHAGMTSIIEGAYEPLAVTLGNVESTSSGSSCNETAEIKYFSSKGAGTIAGISYSDEDVLKYEGSTCYWSLALDGSAAKLPDRADIDALEVGADGTLYMSFDAPVAVPGVAGKVDDSDILIYSGGVFSLWFDGSLYGLTTTDEDIDAMAIDPDGNLIVSTLGAFAVPGPIKGTDDDLLRLSGGTWSLAFDGSHYAGLNKEDITGVAWRADGTIALNLLDGFDLGSVKGDGNDIINCVPSSLGPLSTNCNYTLIWDGSARGLTGVDAIAIESVIVP